MSLFWSLTKVATEDDPTQPVVPPQQPPAAPVAPQTPIPAVPATPVAPQQPNTQPDELSVWQSKNPKLVQNVINFIKNNIGETLSWASEVISTYKADPYQWETFKQQSAILNPNEPFEEFVSRLAGSQKEHKGYEDVKFLDNLDDQINTTIVYFNEQLKDWIYLMANQTDAINPNEPSAIAKGIGGAVENFFKSVTHGGHVPKWIHFADKYNLLPKKVQKQLKEPGNLGLKKTVSDDINNWFSITDDPYPVLSKLRNLAADNDPRLHKALEACAMAVGSQKGQHGESIDITDSSGKAIQKEDPKALSPDLMIEKELAEISLSDENNIMGLDVANEFIKSNPDFINQLRVAKHTSTGEVLLSALVKAKIGTPDSLIESAIRQAFIGESFEQTQNPKTKEWHYTSNKMYNQWVEFFTEGFPELIPDSIDKSDTGAIQKNQELLYPIFIEALKKPEVMQKYMGSPAEAVGPPYNYLRYLYEINKVYDKSNVTKRIAKYGNIQMFKRLSQIATGTIKRELDVDTAKLNAIKADPNSGENEIRIAEDNVNTTARYYTFTKFKAEECIRQLNRLLDTNDKIKLTKDSYVQRDENNQILIFAKHKGGYTDDPNIVSIAGPLTDKNAFMLNMMVDDEVWTTKAIEQLNKTHPNAMKREAQKTFPLSDEFKQATEQYQAANPQAEDRLAGYRIFLAEKLKKQITELGQKLGITFKDIPEMVDFVVKRIQLLKANTGSGNTSRIDADTQGFVTNVLTGQKQRYAETSDLKTLAQSLMLSPEEANKVGEVPADRKKEWQDTLFKFWARAPEYDPQNVDTSNDVNTNFTRAAFRSFAPYLVHKKREAIRKGMINDVFSDNSLFLFLSMMPPTTQMSKTPSELPYGKYIYELVGNRPVGTPLSWPEIEQNLSTSKEVDIYDRLKERPMSRKQYYPSSLHPSGIETREQELDRDKKMMNFKDIQKNKVPISNMMGGKTLQEWKDEFINRMEQRASDNTPELLKQKLNSGVNPVDLAKDILATEYKKNNPTEEVNADQLFQSRLDKFNDAQSRFNPDKIYSPEEYAQSMIENHISTAKYFRDIALKQKKEFSGVDFNKLSPQKQFDLFVPARFKTKKKDIVPLQTRVRSLDSVELNNEAKSDIPERYQQRLNQEPIQQVAIDYVKERKGLDDESALVFLRNNMRRYNRVLQKENEEILQKFDDYLKHYMSEVLTFEKNYRDAALQSLQSKEPFPKRSSVNILMDAITRLSKIGNIVNRLYRLGSKNHYTGLINSIADEAIEEIRNG